MKQFLVPALVLALVAGSVAVAAASRSGATAPAQSGVCHKMYGLSQSCPSMMQEGAASECREGAAAQCVTQQCAQQAAAQQSECQEKQEGKCCKKKANCCKEQPVESDKRP